MSAQKCSGQDLGNYMGLITSFRPMDINFTLKEEKEFQYEYFDPFENKTKITDIKTIIPKYHRCNESYQYGILEYASPCSCKVSFV